MSCLDELTELDELTQQVEPIQTGTETGTTKTYSVPKRTFTITGKTLELALGARFPNQAAFVVICNPVTKGATAVTWVGATSDESSQDGSYFDVKVKRLNQHSNEYTFVPAEHI